MTPAGHVNKKDREAAAPSIDELVDRARALRPFLREWAHATEMDRRVSPEAIAMLADAQLLGMIKPKRFGGLEMGPTAMLRVGHELGRACGSTAWCAMISNANSSFASWWPLEVQKDIWGVNPGNLVAGALAPTGRAEAADGGFTISGRWPYASNCDNAAWYYVSCVLPSPDGAPTSIGLFMVPAEDLLIDQDSWRVSGMQGTGSKTLYCETPVFVPAIRMILFSDVQAGSVPGNLISDNIVARFNFTTFGATCLVSAILGMAQGELDWFVETTRTKSRAPMRPGAPIPASANPFTQERAGRASAMVDAALTLVLQSVGTAEAKVFAQTPLEIVDRVRIRQSFGFAANSCAEVADLLIKGAGATSSDLSSPGQRHWRDISAATRHLNLDVAGIYSLVGQHLFGLPLVGPH